MEIEPSVQKELSSEEWEFKYLNTTGFVPNTKLALLWFNSLSNNSSTKENFIKNFPLQEVDVNHDSEKEAIFSALLTSKLIETTDNGQTHKATDKGSRFLKFINYIS